MSALAVLGADGNLLESCFWRGDNFREFGIYVLRFFKDCNIVYVIIDDRLPVKSKDGRLIFAASKDPNELWVPLIEKAYAKLHGCYKSLIGGYTHYGLADMTGFCPRLIVMREGLLGFSEKYGENEIWTMINQYLKWKSLMGCSIQPNPKEKNKVEADAGNGLFMGHAYSFLAAGEIQIGVDEKKNPKFLRMVKLRNPWGRGEWEGPFSDRSEEYDRHRDEIDRVFNGGVRQQERLEQNFNDGTFLMTFEDWLKYFTSLFIAIQFPESWCGKRAQGKWSVDQGGNREMGTWITNPKFKFQLPKTPGISGTELKHVFIGLYIKDSRMTLGYDYFKDPLYATPLTFDIVTSEELKNFDAKSKRTEISKSKKVGDGDEKGKQPPYNFGTTQIEVFLETGIDYYIVPSLYKRNQAGNFFLTVFADVNQFDLEGSTVIAEAQKPMVVGKDLKEVTLKMSVSQFYERKEALRERIVTEAARLNLSLAQLEAIFSNKEEELSRSVFKRRVMDLGFMLTDFPDDDLVVLDSNNDGTISANEFLDFYKEGLKFVEEMNVKVPPEPPVDDLLFKSIDLSGVLNVNILGGRQIREASSWFNLGKGDDDQLQPVAKSGRNLICYDPKLAVEARATSMKERKSWGTLKHSSPDPVKVEDVDDDPLSLQSSIIDESERPLSPLKTFASARDRRHDSAASFATSMSISQREAIQNAAEMAAAKLHSDGSLQKAEKSRTKHLSALRSTLNRSKNSQFSKISSSMDSVGGSGTNSLSTRQNDHDTMLRKKSSGGRHLKKKDITKDIFAMRWLNYHPSAGMHSSSKPFDVVPMRTALSLGGNVPTVTEIGEVDFVADGSVDSYSVTKKSGFLKNDGSEDLWDYLIDCVITISFARPKATASSFAGSLGASSSLGLFKHDTFVSLKNKRSINKDSILLTKSLEIPATPRVEVMKPVRGHTPTPRSQRKAIGAASVSSHQSKSLIRTLVNEVPEKLASYQKVTDCFEEVYRRIVSVTTTTYEELAGERSISNPLSLSTQSTAYILSLFQKFDKNCNGFISKDEFKVAMNELNVEVSNEECDIFFNRFSCHIPGNIDYNDFLHFFKHNIVGATNSLSHEEIQHNPTHNLISCLQQLRDVLRRTMDEMKRSNINSIEKFFEHNSSHLKIVNSPRAPLENFSSGSMQDINSAIPNNAILQSLELQQAKANTSILQSLGMSNLRVSDMARISRIFGFNVNSLMEFVRLSSLDLIEALDIMDTQICKELSARSGASIVRANDDTMSARASSKKDKVSPRTVPVMPQTSLTGKVPPNLSNFALENSISIDLTEPTTSSTVKIWNAFAPTVDSAASFDTLVKYFNDVMTDSHWFRTSGVTISGVNFDVLTRIVVDILIHSSWNKTFQSVGSSVNESGGGSGSGLNAQNLKAPKDVASLVSNETSIPSLLSFSGLDAYLRINRIHYIERKLKYLMQLESNMSGNSTHLLIHVYLSSINNGSRGDEMVIVADDPLSGEVFTLQLKDPSFELLPRGEKLRGLFDEIQNWDVLVKSLSNTVNNRPGGALQSMRFDENSLYLYNTFDTPLEDSVVSDLLKRLRLVRSRRTSISELIITEDPKFLNQLKLLLDAAANNLPFFYIVNDYYLSFEVDDQLLRQDGKEHNNTRISVRSIVFGSLRKQKALYAFLSQVTSSLRVVLSTYNNSLKESFSWEEMLAHLTNHRNPFITIQLLPKFIPPEKYLYEPVEAGGAFTGEEEDDIDDEDDEGGIDEGKRNEDGIEIPPLPKYPNWQKGQVDFDGSPNPQWNSPFKYNFQSPKLTSCRVIFTEVVKMLLDESWKYVMVMIREGSKKIKPSETGRTPTTKGLIIKEPFRFLTLYDPKTATEYQCGVKADTDLYKMLLSKPSRIVASASQEVNDNKKDGRSKEGLNKGLFGDFKFHYEIKDLMVALNDAAEDNKLIVGPAVTPRLEIQVYNYQDEKVKELLGQCQVSISSVLSGSGIGEKTWVTLVYKTEKPSKDSLENNGLNKGSNTLFGQALLAVKAKDLESKPVRTIDTYAGQIQVELSFRRSIEIEAERQALVDRLRKKKHEDGSQIPSTTVTPRKSITQSAVDCDRQKIKSQHQNEDRRLLEIEKERESKIKELAAENDRLVAEFNKLKQDIGNSAKGSSSIPSAVSLSPTSENDSNQIMKLQHENERLHKDLKNLQQERAKADEEKRKLENEKSLLLKSKTEEDEEKLRLKEELRVLQERYDKILQEQQLVNSRREGNSESQQHSLAVTGSGGGLSTDSLPLSSNLVSLPFTDPISFSSFIRHLLTIFAQRFDKKRVSSNFAGAMQTIGTSSVGPSANSVLDGFFRLLQSYGNAEGLISFKEVLSSCQEVQIEISTEQAVRIVQEIGPNSKKMIQVHQLMDFLTREYNQLMKHNRKNSSGALRSSGEFTLVPGISGDPKSGESSRRFDSDDGKDNVHPPIVSGRSKGVAKLGSPHPSSQTMRSKSTIDVVDNSQETKEQSGKRRPISANATVNIPLLPKNNGKISKGNPVSESTLATSSNEEKNWDIEPLPEGWERKYSEKHKRVSMLFLQAML